MFAAGGRLVNLLFDAEVLGDLGVDTAFGLGRTVLVNKVLEAARALTTICEPDLVVDFLGGMHVAEGGEANVMEGVVRNVVLAEVRPAVLEAPEGEGVQLLAFPHRKSSALSTYIIGEHVRIMVKDTPDD
jgi:hypothetical protein